MADAVAMAKANEPVPDMVKQFVVYFYRHIREKNGALWRPGQGGSREGPSRMAGDARGVWGDGCSEAVGERAKHHFEFSPPKRLQKCQRAPLFLHNSRSERFCCSGSTGFRAQG